MRNVLRTQATLMNADIYPPSESTALYPRTCGGHISPPFIVKLHGSIPAFAGKHQRTALPRADLEVYPRVCGGTVSNNKEQAKAYGLSPRVRENHRSRRPDALDHGSIPACAGEPWPHGAGGERL